MYAVFRRDPRYLVAIAAISAAAACAKEDAPEGSDRPAPLPTTPEHRKPMTAGEVRRYETLVAEQIEGHKEALVAECDVSEESPRPIDEDGGVDAEALKKAAGGTKTKLIVMVVFDEQGKEATRDVIDEAEKESEVARCVAKHLPPLSVPAPQRKLRIKVATSLP